LQFFGLPSPNNLLGFWDGVAVVPSNQRRPPLPLLRDQEVIETIAPERQDRLTRRYTDEAIAFIKAHRDAPFFLYFPLDEVHVPLYPGAAFKGRSRNGAYGDSVEELDASAGELLATLRELQLERDTLVIFTSDNGPAGVPAGCVASAGPFHGGKGTTFEGGMREPTIAWWPERIAAGSHADAIAGLIDLLPTFVALAGGVVPDDHRIDGADLTAVLLGKAEHSSREVQYYFQINTLDAVRRGRWKLAIAPQKERMQGPAPAKKADFHPRLYDLVDDAGERHDVAAAHPGIVAELQQLAQAMDGDLGLTALGPGVRPPDEVPDPRPLLKKR
jgi:arylsulfatase A-like enzyme